MNLMISIRGETEQLPFLPQIAELGAGIELGSYGLIGIRSERDWEDRCALHRAVRARFSGPIAIHGPFIGMEFAHMDHLIREGINRRLDWTFQAAASLNASRVVLHSGFHPEIEIFKLEESWLERNVDFWQQEIQRWADAGIVVVLENDTEKSPDLLVRLADGVDHPSLGLCMDIGHQNVFSDLSAVEWVRRLDQRLYHIHLHDNDGVTDSHWRMGRGTIAFEPFFQAVIQRVPQVTFSVEVEDAMEVKLADLRKIANYFSVHPRTNG